MKNLKITLHNCKQELNQIKEELKNLPEGHLGKKRAYYYQIIKKKHIGITRNNALIRQLCRKKYLQARLVQLENNISKPLSSINNSTPQELISSFPKAYQDAPIDYYYHPSIESWQAKSPKQNTINTENAIYTSTSDIQFRSMSERTIAEQLENNGLPYHYDTVIQLGGKKISPDFIIKNPFTAKTFIWEHFGAFNQERYADSMNDKMSTYMNNGFVPSENLISTYEYHLRKPHCIQELIEQIIL